MAFSDREAGRLVAKVSALENDVRLLRERVHDHASRITQVLLEQEAIERRENERSDRERHEQSNWPVTVRHVGIAVGSSAATVGVLKLLGIFG